MFYKLIIIKKNNGVAGTTIIIKFDIIIVVR